MTPTRRAELITAVDDLTEVRQRLVKVARRQEELQVAAREHFEATRGDVKALFEQEADILDRLRSVLDAETFGDDTHVLDRLRWGRLG